MIKDEEYKVTMKIETAEALKQLRQIKKEIKETVKECSFAVNKMQIKRKDILVIKMNYMMKEEDIQKITQRFKKMLHRKVLVIDKSTNLETIITTPQYLGK